MLNMYNKKAFENLCFSEGAREEEELPLRDRGRVEKMLNFYAFSIVAFFLEALA